MVWTKDNPTPWNDIKPDEGTKLLTVNQHFDKSYVNVKTVSFVASNMYLPDGSARSCKAEQFKYSLRRTSPRYTHFLYPSTLQLGNITYLPSIVLHEISANAAFTSPRDCL